MHTDTDTAGSPRVLAQAPLPCRPLQGAAAKAVGTTEQHRRLDYRAQSTGELAETSYFEAILPKPLSRARCRQGRRGQLGLVERSPFKYRVSEKGLLLEKVWGEGLGLQALSPPEMDEVI